ncbi:BamA/TamA family outer membrane protein [Photobacterium ganghwense]|uniref:BamA/TamA family outer membrane protein n=1 Tax=Photobacterium ganghwense TaxID=320778 RepID=UPI001A8FB583|nr:BamA/TamA family outer membrane protein [Photobacterium ganghwense]QSV12839.1 BamA/TamA family outer membrane protein [Photobacterium ganghwense]
MKHKRLWLAMLFTVSAVAKPAAGNETPPADNDLSLYHRTQAWFSDLLLDLGADGQFTPEKGIDWSVMPGPFYTPEKKLGVGVSAIGLYLPDLNDQVSQPSAVTLNGFASINGAYGLSVSNASYLQRDTYRLYFNAEVIDSPDIFYGVGIDAGQYNPRVDYTRRAYSVSMEGKRKIFPSTYFGLGAQFTRTEASDGSVNTGAENTRIAASSSVNGNSDIAYRDAADMSAMTAFPHKQSHIGLKASLTYDSRDFALNASSGRLVQIEYFYFDQALGSDHDFERIKLNYSDYLTLKGIPGMPGIVAWQVRLESNRGDVSWDQMALLGGADALRGYEQGHYRDRNMLLSQVEYRRPLGGRHGMVYWLGGGTLASDFSELGQDKWLYSAGVGYRFEIKQRVNLRLDMGFGNDQSGFYFSINEAF